MNNMRSDLNKHTQMGHCCYSVCVSPGPREPATLYTDATFHVIHIPLKEVRLVPQSTDHLFKSVFVPWATTAGNN